MYYKKIFAVLLIFTILFNFMVLTATANAVPDRLNATEYAPWLFNWHMQTKYQADNNISAGEGGQVVMSMACSDFDKQIILFGTDTTGLWRSTDGGNNWVSINNGINMVSVPDIEFSPYERNTVYMVQSVSGTTTSSETYLNRTTYDGVYKSTDNGLTWSQILHAKIMCSTYSNRLLAFDESGALYVLTNAGVRKTENGGKSWINLGLMGLDSLTSTSGMFDLYVSADGKTIVTACESAGIGVSFDGGNTWERRNGVNGYVTAYGFAVNPLDNQHWFATFADYAAEQGSERSRGLYESRDNGLTWSLIKNYFKNEVTSPITRIYFSPPDSNGKTILYVFSDRTSQSLRYSKDMGITWNLPVYPTGGEVDNPQTFLGISPYYPYPLCFVDPTTVFLPTTGGIGKSYDAGANFTYGGSGFSGAAVRDFEFLDDKILLGFMDKGLGVTDSKFDEAKYPTAKIIETGRYENSKTVSEVAVDPQNENHIIIALGAWSKQILSESFDNGATWTQIQKTDSESAYRYIGFCKTDANTIYSTHYISRDGGKTWSENYLTDGVRLYIQDASTLDDNLVVGFAEKNVCYSYDKGFTWSATNISDTPVDVRCDLFDKDIIWVTTSSGSVIKIQNGVAKPTALKNVGRLYTIAQNPNNPNHLLAGGAPASGRKGYGLLETTDGGARWYEVEGMPGTKLIYRIQFIPNTNLAIIGSYNGTFVYDFNKYKKYLDENVIARSSEVKHKVAVTGEVDKSYAGKQITMLLIKSDADELNVKESDIGYIAETTVNSDGSYIFRFDFDKFTYGSDGMVDNYKILVNELGKNFKPGITKAVAVQDMVKVNLSMNSISGSVYANANIINLFNSDDLTYTMILAFYDENHRLLEVKTVNNSIQIDGSIANIDCEIPENAFKASALIWNDMQRCIPFCAQTQIIK